MSNLTLRNFQESLKHINQYPTEFIQHNLILKLKEDRKSIILGHSRDINSNLRDSLCYLHKDKVIDYVKINRSELTSYLNKRFNGVSESNLEAYTENDLNKIANNAPIVNLVNSIIIDGINMGASDIHLESYKSKVDLRYRVDGVLEDGEEVKTSIYPAISSRIKIMSNLDIIESRLPQDGRVTVTIEDQKVDLRVSIVPLSSGESIVIRLFTIKENLTTLKDLGFKGSNLNNITNSLKNPNGLIMISGPTGSGKTTTLHSMIKILNNHGRKIITIEDPVEYTIPGVNQIEVKPEIGLTFSNILKRVLRQDPDIIMVGEIRDKETANLVIRASLTGHLVLSTLHTNDSISVINRLRDLGIKDYLISSVLKASFAQRLIRRVCLECKGTGCPKCQNRGYRGRISLSEGFLNSEKLEELIASRATSIEIKKYLSLTEFKELKGEAKELINSELTTVEEVERVLKC